jgi:hypothetical protein
MIISVKIPVYMKKTPNGRSLKLFPLLMILLRILIRKKLIYWTLVVVKE